jgi:hypothetical protein
MKMERQCIPTEESDNEDCPIVESSTDADKAEPKSEPELDTVLCELEGKAVGDIPTGNLPVGIYVDGLGYSLYWTTSEHGMEVTFRLYTGKRSVYRCPLDTKIDEVLSTIRSRIQNSKVKISVYIKDKVKAAFDLMTDAEIHLGGTKYYFEKDDPLACDIYKIYKELGTLRRKLIRPWLVA